MTNVLATTIATLANRVTKVFPAQIRAAIEPLTDDQLWWRPNEGSNSIGNLMLHVSGSLNHFLGRNIGGIPFDRDRAAEFAERREIPRAELLATFEEMIARATRTFETLTPERLGSPSPEPAMHTLLVEDVLNVALHFSTHTGQIVWISKLLTEGALREVWIKSHRSEGAWKSE
jgi:hypothetical protein